MRTKVVKAVDFCREIKGDRAKVYAYRGYSQKDWHWWRSNELTEITLGAFRNLLTPEYELLVPDDGLEYNEYGEVCP